MNLDKIQKEIRKYEEFIEKNPDSPLLVRLASLYLEIGNVEKAITLCNRAIQKYPDYSTAHLIMARCYIEIKAYSKALAELNRVVEILPDSKFVIDMISKISLKQGKEESIKKIGKLKTVKEDIKIKEVELPEVDLPEVGKTHKEIYFIDQKLTDELGEEIFEMPKVETEVGKAKDENIRAETQASYLDELIKRLEEAKGKQNIKTETAKEPAIDFKEENLSYEDISIVTPALAEILTKQGAYDEAIKVYRKLIEQRPSEKEKYESEIRKLEEKLGK
ncbi:MAG: tetratricopeptide repeat protein [Candidatus Kryptonium sp.]|nr:tetratricopeptide repeat protein [Candidatus Kryptonium sp.]MCX7761963.1 tetratricopeptide repeat protein [Candidatus Kryptonium sp.]MDW8108705.1 tetratricopeptide repeat protein [Candidatus Kryptonium sp.]